jgi:two-component system NtrC family sensor kinase
VVSGLAAGACAGARDQAAVVAHEINNPLSGILTYSRVVKRWILNNFASAPRTEEMSGSLDLIASESKRCGELVKNLLSFSRITPMNLEWSDLSQVIDRCVRLVQHKMDMAGIQLNLALANELPPVHCDPNQIEQVVLAMVINAIDAMPQGGNLWISTRLETATSVELIIRDDGMGIPDEHLPHIFEPFYTSKESGGSGLGLAISQNIVERHGGSIAVHSVPGQGTSFKILLPVDSQRPALASDSNRTLTSVS